MRWSTRLKGRRLFILILASFVCSCQHLVSSASYYHSREDYQHEWDYGGDKFRDRNAINQRNYHQPLFEEEESAAKNFPYRYDRDGRSVINGVYPDEPFSHLYPLDNTLYREQLRSINDVETAGSFQATQKSSFNDIVTTHQRWPPPSKSSKIYFLNHHHQSLTAEPSILGSRRPVTPLVNQHLDVDDGKDINIKNVDEEDRDVVTNDADNNDEEGEDETTHSINVLNVSSKDSPYALINKYFSEREDNYEEKNSAYKKAVESGEIVNNIKGVNPDDVWLSDGGLLVLKGGVSRFAARNGDTISGQRRKWIDDPWEPLDDYEAPFREPILPPPDFIPNDTGVGVPLPPEEDAGNDGGNSIESVLNNSLFSRRPKKIERELEDNEIKTLPPTAKKKIKNYTKNDQKYFVKPHPSHPPPPPKIRFDPILEEEKHINEMENFRPERRIPSQLSKTPPPPRGSELDKTSDELILNVKTNALLVDRPVNEPTLVTVLPKLLPQHPPSNFASPSPLKIPPTEHISNTDFSITTTTVASNTVSSLPPLPKTTPYSSSSSASYPSRAPHPTESSSYFVSTSTPGSYSFAFQTSYKSKPLIVKNRKRVLLGTPSSSSKNKTTKPEYIQNHLLETSSPMSSKAESASSFQITTPMYTTPHNSPSPSSVTSHYRSFKSTSSPTSFESSSSPRITTTTNVGKKPITIAVNNRERVVIPRRQFPITTTTIKVTPPRQRKKTVDNIKFKSVAPRFNDVEETKYYKNKDSTRTSVNSIHNYEEGDARDKKSLSSSSFKSGSSSFSSPVSPPYNNLLPESKRKITFAPTVSPVTHVVRATTTPPTVLALPPRVDPAAENIFKKFSKDFAFGNKLYPSKKSSSLINKSSHSHKPSSLSSLRETIASNEIFSNEISENDIGTRRRASNVVGGGGERGSYYHLVSKHGRGISSSSGRSNNNVRKLPQYHFTVGKFPSNPFIALKRKLAARSKKEKKKRKRHFFRPWTSNKLASDSVTVASNAISKLTRSAAPSIQQRQLPFVQQRSHRLQHSNGGGYGGDGKIYVTRRPRYLSSVRRSGHGYASFFCGGKGCKSWGYTFRA